MMSDSTYTGFRAVGKIYVTRGDRPLTLPVSLIRKLKLTTGYSWGDESLSAKTLAYMLLLDATGRIAPAIKWYQDFLKEKVKTWPADKNWLTTKAEILAWLEAKENPPRAAMVPAPIADPPPPMEAIPPKRRKPE